MVFSLMLVVAIAVGYIGRRSEVAEVRDQELTRAAAVGAARVDAFVEATRIAAISAGDDPSAAVRAVRGTYPAVSACARADDEPVCDGPLAAQIPTADLAVAADSDRADVLGRSDTVLIEAHGEDVALRILAPVDQWSGSMLTEVTVEATTNEPVSGVGSIEESGGKRQTSAPVLSAPHTFVLAWTTEPLSLPQGEEFFYALVAGLALLLLALAGTTLFLEQRSLEERATFDALTKLPNRGEFERRAADVLSSTAEDTTVCLLLFDLNDFKQVNDTYGHQVGDELLVTVANRLAQSVRDRDLVARWGGDEFVILMPAIGSEEMGVRRARQIAEHVAGRTRLDGADDAIRIRTSVGVALWPAHATTLDGLLDAADEAMYRAKRDGTVAAVAKAPRPAPAIERTLVV